MTVKEITKTISNTLKNEFIKTGKIELNVVVAKKEEREKGKYI